MAVPISFRYGTTLVWWFGAESYPCDPVDSIPGSGAGLTRGETRWKIRP